MSVLIGPIQTTVARRHPELLRGWWVLRVVNTRNDADVVYLSAVEPDGDTIRRYLHGEAK